MKEYYCLRCGYKSNRKSNTKEHLNRKRVCEPILSNISVIKCLDMLEENDSKKIINFLINQLKSKDIKMKSLIDKSYNVENNDFKDIDKVLINSNNNNVINHITNHIDIHVNGYSDTDYTILQDGARTCIKRNGEFDFGKFLNLLHFNESFPQNHNICIINKKEKSINVLENGKFVEYDKGNTGLERIFKEKLDFIEQNENMFDMTTVEASGIMKDDYFKYGNYDDKEKRDLLYKEVYLPLLNGRTLVLQTKNKMEK